MYEQNVKVRMGIVVIYDIHRYVYVCTSEFNIIERYTVYITVITVHCRPVVLSHTCRYCIITQASKGNTKVSLHTFIIIQSASSRLIA